MLTGMAALILSSVLAKQQNNVQAAAWREALVSAEAGTERAMAELRATVDDPTQAFTGWVVLNPDGTPATSQAINRTGRWPADYPLEHERHASSAGRRDQAAKIFRRRGRPDYARRQRQALEPKLSHPFNRLLGDAGRAASPAISATPP